MLLACRTATVIELGTGGGAATETASDSGQQADSGDSSPTRRAVQPTFTRADPTVAPEPTELPEPPTEVTIPTLAPPPEPPAATQVPPPTDIPPPTRPPQPTDPPTTAPTAGPTRCPQTYCAVLRGCQPDGNTIIEGVVYNAGAPENGVTVRVALSPGAYPLVDDFRSGTDPINPGQPDPNNPGRYFLQLKPGAAEKGNWYVFVVDQPRGTRQMSDAVLIQTQDATGSCQHAFVDFHR